MARYREANCRLCRREGEKLFLKGERCVTAKCALNRRSSGDIVFMPGQHGQIPKKLSDYGLQLREKQKVKRMYGILEKQFRKYFMEAHRMKGVTGENLMILLERRLDNVLYRLGFASSRAQSRQLVRHGHILVNNRKVNIPSYQVKLNDLIKIKEGSRNISQIQENIKKPLGRVVPSWLEVDYENFSAKVVNLPSREEAGLNIKDSLVVEFYSR